MQYDLGFVRAFHQYTKIRDGVLILKGDQDYVHELMVYCQYPKRSEIILIGFWDRSHYYALDHHVFQACLVRHGKPLSPAHLYDFPIGNNGIS